MTTTLDDRSLDAWLAEHLWDDARCRGCGRLFSRHPWDGSIDGSPCLEPRAANYSSTGDGMLQVLSEMKVRGYDAELHQYVDPRDDAGVEPFTCGFWSPRRLHGYWAGASTLPRAIAEAAKAALEAS